MTKEMNKRITSLFLAFTMLLQIFLPQNIFAEGDKSLPQDKYVKVGMIDGKSYDAKIMNELNRIAAKNRKSSPGKPGFSLFSKGPYFGDNNEPKDEDKPKYFGNVSAKLDLKGLDGNEFQWNEIFGVDESGNPKPAQIIFRQMDAESSTDTGIEYILQITKGGNYTWSDGEGKPTKLPLFSKGLKPYRYEVRIDERVSDKVKLLTEVIFGTEGSSPTFSPENAEGEIIANITLGLTYQQIASTKFKSEWHTDVVETDRPGMKANFAFDDEGEGLSPVSVELPKNDKDTKIIRDWLNDFDPELVVSIYLEKTPDVKIDETTAGLTFEEADRVKTVKSGDHKYKYDFTYDVIDGGKLTMTEILPVTFEANGGKFASIEEGQDQKIVKEVEYDGTLTEKAEDPTKDRETFKGWSTTADGKTPATDADFKNITTAKTFYAIWEDKAFTADGLTVHESFKDDSGYVNDFIPTIEQLKGQVKVDRKELAEQDQLAILNDDGQPLTDETAIKDYLYTKLGEENDNKVDRTVEIKGRVTDAGGKTHDVTIPIKVFKNIYEAMTEEGKPNYVPEGYVKVTLDPTTKAVESQKYFYYVNPEAKVVIPGKDPVGKDDNQFAKWLIKGTETEYKLVDKPRHKFEAETTIEAQYVSDVIPGNPDGSKPDTVPENYVKVNFVLVPEIGGNVGGTFEKDAITVYYVNPNKEVTIPQPETSADIGYEFRKWKQDTTTAKKYDVDTTVNGSFKRLDNIIPATNDDGTSNSIPDGYVTVTFTDGVEGKVHGKITSGKTVYYVNPKANKKLKHLVLESHNSANRPIVTPEVGYKFTGWLQGNNYDIVRDVTVPAEYQPIADVIPKTNDDGSENDKPKGYVTVKLIPTSKATDEKEKIYFVNSKKEVTITNKPEGKKEKIDEIDYTYNFTGWKVTSGTIASWTDEKIKGTFTQDTDITAQYSTSVNYGELIPAPVPKKAVVTPKGEEPDASTLIENKDKLPNGTTFTYTDDGTPDVKNPGDTNAKVKVEYPNGKTVIVEVPITVVDNVVPQEGKDKPKVPDNYVKVTVDTTDAATPNTKFKKVFWVKPKVKVTIPDILAPTGKEVMEDGVTKTNKFVKWQRQGADPEKFYETEIKDTFTSDTTIVATYEYDKNVEPVGKNNPWIPQGSNPSPKDFIENPYDDNDPNNPNNLPPGTKLEFVKGKEPDTSEPGEGKTTTIKVTYPNGEVREVPVTFRVTGDVIEQTDPDKKPNVPDNFVEVIVKTTDKATEDVTRTFWVNPTKVVAINVADPEGKDLGDKKYVFTGWDKSLRDQFTMRTVITAQYQKYAYDPDVITGVVATDLKVQPPLKDYVDEIQSKEPFRVLRVVAQPDVSEPGMKMAKVEIQFRNGVKKIVDVRVYVKPDPKIIEKPVPGDCNNSCDQSNVGKDALNTTDHYQYLIGYPDGNFGPNKGMTRAEAATMFTRLLRQRPAKGQRYNAGLNDIHAGDWYANTVGYAVQRGIVSGYPDGSFKPNKPITRAEFAAIASRFDALAQGNDIAFSDLAPSHWGYNAIRSAATKGWISGYPDNTFRPEQAITRAEVTAITNRMLNRHADLYWIDAHPRDVIRFGDVKRSDWYFEPIMEATMGHDFIRDRDKKTEHWTGLNGKSFI